MNKGTITQEQVAAAKRAITETFKSEIAKMTGPKPGLSKKQALDIGAGFEDGARAMLGYLVAQGFVEIED